MLALHVVIVAAVLVFSRTRFWRVTASTPLEIQFLPAPNKAVPPVPPPVRPPNHREAHPPAPSAAASAPASPSALTLSAPATPTNTGPPEAGAAAGSPPTVAPPFESPPLHYAGQEIGSASGDTMVFVSSSCYVVMPKIPPIQNASNNGRPQQVYCIRKNKTARGDLFKDLPVYKKLHPDN